jgi:hypothetical protein
LGGFGGWRGEDAGFVGDGLRGDDVECDGNAVRGGSLLGSDVLGTLEVVCMKVVYDEHDDFYLYKTQLSQPAEKKEPKEERALDMMMIPSHPFRTIERMLTIQTLAGS